MRLSIDQIMVSKRTRVRVRVDKDTVKQYSESIKSGATLPPITVYAKEGSSRYILADGEHRILALQMLGKKTIGCEVKEGGVPEARRHALGANAEHGLRRTDKDRRRAVNIAFDDPQFDELSNRDIAKICRVSHSLVNNMRNELRAGDGGNISTDALDSQELSDSDSNLEKGASEATDNKVDTPEGNYRPRRPPPTQDAYDKEQLVTAFSIIRGFPYNGTNAYSRLEIGTRIDDLNYCLDWLTEALQEHVASQHHSAAAD